MGRFLAQEKARLAEFKAASPYFTAAAREEVMIVTPVIRPAQVDDACAMARVRVDT